MIEFLIERMEASCNELAVALPDRSCTYGELLALVRDWRAQLTELPPGSVVSIEGDYGPESVALFLALSWCRHVAVPLSPDSAAHHDSFIETANVEFRGRLGAQLRLEPTGQVANHALYAQLREEQCPGLVLFSSGSTGRSKAAVHNLSRLLEKYQVRRQQYRTLVFLLLDHIGGVNTLFYTASNGGTVVASQGRSPAAVCEAIEKYRVELLPTSPTFLNLLLLSESAGAHELDSLRIVPYGAEPLMPLLKNCVT